jgi:hypothetical protein
MRLHHSQDGSTYSGNKLMFFVYVSFFVRKEQNALAFDRDTYCYLALCLKITPPLFDVGSFGQTLVSNQLYFMLHI